MGQENGIDNGTTTNGHAPNSYANGASKPNIPIIDFAHWTSESTKADRLKIAKGLVDACRDYGFVQIVNHGVPKEKLARAFEISKKLYDLPQEEKEKAPHPPGWAVHRGYSWPGLEKVSQVLSETDDAKLAEQLREVSDFKESYEIGADDNPDMPNVWLPPSSLPEFRPFMTSFYYTLYEAAARIYKAIALGIGLEDENHLLDLHSGTYNQLRLLHYPALPAKALEEGKVARMPAHSDWSSMTMLFQDDCGGLQVEDPNVPGKFMDVDPVEGALVMNVGDLLMRWSNDYLRSTLHRVVLPPRQDRITGDNRMTRERYSIVYFNTTDPDRLVSCLPTCMDEENPAKYEPITNRDYSAMRYRTLYVAEDEEKKE